MTETPAKDDKTHRNRRELYAILVPSLLITILGFVVAYQFVEPAPPRQITMAAGPEGGAYQAFAARYREALAAEGIELQVRATRGSRENLELLADPDSGVDFALTQGGTGSAEEFPTLLSMGAIFFEPLWIFAQGTPPESLAGLKGRRLAIGVEGSGTRYVAEQLLAGSEVDQRTAELQPKGGEEASRALAAGKVDVAFFVGAVDSPLVQGLLKSDAQLMSLRRAASYARRWRFLSAVRLLEGIVDFQKNIPPQEIQLVAPVAALTMKETLHPALVPLLLGCASRIHGDAGLFEDESVFPTARFTDFPLGEEAERFLKRGPSFLNRFLPFWAANLVDRLIVLLIPLITLLIPLFKLFPPLYSWRIRSRFKKWYRDLQRVDFAISQGSEPDRRAAVEEVKRIQNELAKITVPPSYGDELYHLRFHVRWVREKLATSRGTASHDKTVTD